MLPYIQACARQVFAVSVDDDSMDAGSLGWLTLLERLRNAPIRSSRISSTTPNLDPLGGRNTAGHRRDAAVDQEEC